MVASSGTWRKSGLRLSSSRIATIATGVSKNWASCHPMKPVRQPPSKRPPELQNRVQTIRAGTHVFVLNTVDACLTAREIRHVRGKPQPGPPVVTAMPLEYGQRVLAASPTAKKIGIVGEEPNPRRALNEPIADRLRHPDFGFERPPVRAH